MTTPLLTVPEAAAALRLSLTHTYRLIEAGDIASVRVGRAVRITETAINDFIAARTTPARPAMRRRLRMARTGT